MPQGEALPPEVPEEIRKDFDEARRIVNYSIRCAVVLLRICTEHILHWLVEERLPEKTNEMKSAKTLNAKINLIVEKKNPNTKEEVIKSKIDGISSKTFDMLHILKEYGNDNSHSIRKIDDSDTMEAFNDLSTFIISISKQIIFLNAEDEKIKQMNQNIAQKNQN